MAKSHILLFLFGHCVFCILHEHTFYIQKNSTNIGFGSFYGSYSVSSIIDCARKCKEDSNCKTASYVEERAVCYLVDDETRLLNYHAGSVVLKRVPIGTSIFSIFYKLFYQVNLFGIFSLAFPYTGVCISRLSNKPT